MITMQRISANTKTGPVATSYRAGDAMFGTCPTTCALRPTDATSAKSVDYSYFDALLAAVPRDGLAFTYTHFRPRLWFARWFKRMAARLPTTVVNASHDTERAAARALQNGIPSVVAVPFNPEPPKTWRKHGARFVRCPAEYSAITCASCGGGKPLCARPWRDYVIAFFAHGAARKRVGTDQSGGCYASGGNVALHWRKLSLKPREDDAARLSAFVETLPRGSVMRHHIAGDIGLD